MLKTTVTMMKGKYKNWKKEKLKVIICGTTFGQFYMDAISRLKDIFEFAGIFAGGSKRSVMCAESYGVPLYTKI